MAAPLTSSHLVRCDAMNLRIVTFLPKAVTVRLADGSERREWLPRDIVGRDGMSLIVHRPADANYNFDGWQPEHDGMFGGRSRDIHGALNWLQRAIDVRAGRASDFRGV